MKMEFAYIFIGFAAGFAIAWLLALRKQKNTDVLPSIPLIKVESKYIKKELYLELKEDNAKMVEQLRLLSMDLASSQEIANSLKEKLKEQKTEVDEMQQRFRIEMQNLSNNILEEKSKRFLELNEKNVSEILNPLKEKIKDFEKKVEESSEKNLKWNTALQQQVKDLSNANQQISDDARKLTNALKGDKKLQGNWGEMQLELILEKAGLEKGIHYNKEVSLISEDGQRYRPDYIINLPENKNLIIDSKVSLVAYEGYFNSEDEKEKSPLIREHLLALNNHIAQLGSKNYQNLYKINAPDYVMLFVPIEPALNLALKQDQGLFEKALSKNIVLVSTSTLLATLRTISYIWKQENQRKNVVEIARESGALYDKFVGFMDDLNNIGKKLEGVQKDYDAAMNKLYTSPQKGGTIIGRIERLKTLGADASKQIPQNLLDKID